MSSRYTDKQINAFLFELLNYHGWERQALQAAEELNECAAALVRMVNRRDERKGLLSNLQEEIADASLCLRQMKNAFSPDAIDEISDYKIERLAARTGLRIPPKEA